MIFCNTSIRSSHVIVFVCYPAMYMLSLLFPYHTMEWIWSLHMQVAYSLERWMCELCISMCQLLVFVGKPLWICIIKECNLCRLYQLCYFQYAFQMKNHIRISHIHPILYFNHNVKTMNYHIYVHIHITIWNCSKSTWFFYYKIDRLVTVYNQ